MDRPACLDFDLAREQLLLHLAELLHVLFGGWQAARRSCDAPHSLGRVDLFSEVLHGALLTLSDPGLHRCTSGDSCDLARRLESDPTRRQGAAERG
jgi:hypothetical protein